MSMFTLAISCLTTVNSPWFMDRTFQVSMQYCSLQYQILFPSSITSTTGCCFCFGSVSSFFLELFLHMISSSILGTYWPGEFIFQCHIFFLVIVFMGFWRQKYWNDFPFPSPVDHVLSELFIMTCQSWVALYGMALSFIELDKSVVHVISLISFLCLWFPFCLPSNG